MLEVLFFTHALTAIFGVIFAVTKVQNKAFFPFSISLILIQSLAIGLRDPYLATDTREYVSLFLGTSHFADRIEPFFMLGLWVIKVFTSQPQVFLIIYATILNLTIFSFLFRVLGSRSLLVFAFFGATHAYWLVHVQVMRNGLAAALFLLGVSYFLTEKKRRAAILAGLAVGTHYSTIAVLAASFVGNSFRDRKVGKILMSLAASGVIAFLVIKILPEISALTPWAERAVAYSYYGEATFEKSTLGLQYIFLFILLPGFMLTWRKHQEIDKSFFWIYLSIVMLSFLLWFNILYRDRVLLTAQMLEPLLMYRLLVVAFGVRLGGAAIFSLLLPYMFLIIFIWGPSSVLSF